MMQLMMQTVSEALSFVVFAAAMSSVGDVPAPLSLAVWHARDTCDGVDAIELGSYLISEHRGEYFDTPCDGSSDPSACGPFNLVVLWAREYGGDREHILDAATIAARVICYSRRRHARHGDSVHSWRAHLKCAPGGRDECGVPVSRWEFLSDELSRSLAQHEKER